MTLPVALGVNLWVVAVALPLVLAAHARALGEVPAGAIVVATLVPLAVLAAGAAQRRGRAIWLLALFPTLVMLPEALAPTELLTRVLPPAASILAAASLLAFLATVARAEARAERASEPPSHALTRRLHQDPVPTRWRRRLRVYRGLAVTSALFPLVLVGAVDLSPSFAASVRASFGEHAAHAQALATVAVGLLWIVLWRAYILVPLHGHLQHDRDLLAAIEADRRHARRGRPRAGFYFAVAVALAAMIAVVWQRAR